MLSEGSHQHVLVWTFRRPGVESSVWPPCGRRKHRWRYLTFSLSWKPSIAPPLWLLLSAGRRKPRASSVFQDTWLKALPSIGPPRCQVGDLRPDVRRASLLYSALKFKLSHVHSQFICIFMSPLPFCSLGYFRFIFHCTHDFLCILRCFNNTANKVETMEEKTMTARVACLPVDW